MLVDYVNYIFNYIIYFVAFFDVVFDKDKALKPVFMIFNIY